MLKLAHDRLVERTGIGKQLEQKREAEQKQKMAARDAEWQQYIAQREAEQLKREMERDAQRQREAWAKTRWAKHAARINTRGPPGHATNPKTMDDTLREVASRHYG